MEKSELERVFEDLVSRLGELIATDVIDNRTVHESLMHLQALFRRTKYGSLYDSYDGYVQRLSDQFSQEMDKIEAEYGFDNGPEFEIAICKFLSRILPEQYGVCRGFVVDKDNNKAGDDIIIYDRYRFPVLRSIGKKNEDFSRKEYVPIEAVYAYIEAKHTINLKPCLGDGQCFAKAVSQVNAVKQLVSKRQTIPFNPVFKDGRLHIFPEPEKALEAGFPDKKNPFFAVILARFVNEKKGGKRITAPDEIYTNLEAMKEEEHELFQQSEKRLDKLDNAPEAERKKAKKEYERLRSLVKVDHVPDMIVLGSELLLLPVFENEFRIFHVPGSDMKLQNIAVPKLAFGVAMCVLMQSLTMIELGEIPFSHIITKALNIRLADE